MSVFKDLVVDDSQITGFKTLREGEDIEKWCNEKGYKLNERVSKFLANNYKKLNKYTDLIILPDGKLTDKLEEGGYGWSILYTADYFKAFSLIMDISDIKAYNKEDSPLLVVINDKILLAIAPRVEG